MNARRKFWVVGFLLLVASIVSLATVPAHAAVDYSHAFQVDRELCYSLTNYYGKSFSKRCFPASWQELFAQDGFKDRDYFADEQASFHRAMINGKGAVAVINNNRDDGDNSSNPYFLTIYWVEDNSDGAMKLRFAPDGSSMYLDGAGPDVHSAEIAPSSIIQSGNYATPSYLWGSSSGNGFRINGVSGPRLFYTTFPVDYPAGYNGLTVPANPPDVPYEPAFDYSHAFNLDDGLCYSAVNYNGKSLDKQCYGETWRDLFVEDGYYDRSYFAEEKASFERALTNGKGAWAVLNTNRTEDGVTNDPYFMTVYWVENNSLGRAKLKFNYDGNRLYLDGGGLQVHSATIAPASIIQGGWSQSPSYLWGESNGAGFSLGRGANDQRLFSTTFPVEYPDHYNGPVVPGSPSVIPLPDGERLDYLALGDSYSSGEGDTATHNGHSYYLPDTDSEADNCHISSRSYPFLLRDAWDINTDAMRSVACSGARVLPDYLGPMDNYPGQNQRLNGVDDVDSVRSAALENFTPGYVRQIEFVKKYQPKVVTFTGGGNDVGFGDIIAYCATPAWEGIFVNDTCDYAIEGSYLNKTLYDSIDTHAVYAKRFINKMKATSPRTKIVMIGYPSFVASDRICVLNSAALNNLESLMVNNAVSYMNAMLKRVAAEEGVLFVDIEDSLDGGRLCEGSEYMTGLLDMSIDKIRNNKIDEMFHPNAVGHAKIAASIEAANIPGRDMPAELMDPSGETTPSIAIRTQLVDGDIILTTRSSANVEAATQTFADGSTVTTTTFSEKTDMGTYTATAEGALSSTPDFSAVGPGQHVLVVEGTSPSGEPVKLYQFITIRASETDADGDGILDTQDNCTFINHWFDEATGEDVCARATDNDDGVNDTIVPTNAGNSVQESSLKSSEVGQRTTEAIGSIAEQDEVAAYGISHHDSTTDVLGDSTVTPEGDSMGGVLIADNLRWGWLLFIGVSIMIGGAVYAKIRTKNH